MVFNYGETNMKIEAIDIYRVSMPLKYPFRTAFGNDEAIESILLRIYSEGIYGWGESPPWKMPAYSAESAATAFIVVKEYLSPLILGKDVESGRQLQEFLRPVKDNYFAKAAIDSAWWDLYAKKEKKPLWKVLGGTRNVVDVGADFGIMESIGGLLGEIEKAVSAGFKRVKLKYRPGWEQEMLKAVRKAFPDIVCHVDCNSAYTLDDMEMFKELDDYNLAMIEQPLMHDDLIDHATLQKNISTPICLDESITSEAKARKAIEIGACKWINIKYHRVGGITNALAIIKYAEEKGTPCWIGSMLESSLGGYINAALATLSNVKYPSDIFPTDRFYEKDLCVPEMVLSGPSEITLPEAAGIGAEPEASMLDKMKLESSHV